jgi:hypothetical protein
VLRGNLPALERCKKHPFICLRFTPVNHACQSFPLAGPAIQSPLVLSSITSITPSTLLHEYLSNRTPMANSVPSSFQSTFREAICIYKKRTRKDLLLDPLAVRLQPCDSHRAVILVLQEQAQVIDQSGSSSETLTKWISPTVNVLFALSSSVQEGIVLVIFGACSFGTCPEPFIFQGIIACESHICWHRRPPLSEYSPCFPCSDRCHA